MSLDVDVKRGDERFLYRDTASNYSSPTYNLVDSLASNKITREPAGKEYNLRRSAFVGVKPGKTKLGLTIEFADIEGDADLEAFIAAAENRTPLHLCYANGDITDSGVKATKAVYAVTKQESDQPEDDISKHTFECSVTAIENYEPTVYTTT